MSYKRDYKQDIYNKLTNWSYDEWRDSGSRIKASRIKRVADKYKKLYEMKDDAGYDNVKGVK